MAEKTPTITPNVVPATFTPTPEQYVPQVTAELRSKQAGWTRGYTLQQIERVEHQRKLGFYKREDRWREGYTEEASNALLDENIKVAKTARTIMLDKISEWAGSYEETDFYNNVLPDVWGQFVSIVQSDGKPIEAAEEVEPIEETETAEVAEDDLALEELEAIQVIERPEVPVDLPQSVVEAPPEPSLGDVLGKISEDNSNK